MTVEQGTRPMPASPDGRTSYEPIHRVSYEQINKILSLDPKDPNYPLSGPFDRQYKASNKVEKKYAIALALIEDGRYPDPQFLVRHLYSPNQQLSVEERSLAKELKAKLTVKLLEREALDPNSKEADEAEDEVLRFVDSNALLTKIKGKVPIDVMGAITNALFFDGIEDAKKLEKLRSWSTRPLLRPYLGDLAVPVSSAELDLRDLALSVPDKIFKNKDSATFNIVKNFFERELKGLFVEGEAEGFRKIDEMASEYSDVRREFFDDIYLDFLESKDVPIPSKFKPFVEGWFTDLSPSPLFPQKYAVYKFMQSRRKVINGKPGTTKTATAYMGMEAAGAQKVTIFGPAIARKTWPKEAEKIYKEEDKPDVFTINSMTDFDNPRVESARYVFVGSEMLSRAWNEPQLYKKITDALVDKRGTDGLIFDESDEFRNEGANCSKMLMDLVTKIRAKYEHEHLFEIPTLALTATPIASSLEDMDVTMALVYPERFALPNKKEDGKNVFSHQVLKDPQIAYMLLFGEELMLQLSLKEMFGDKAPVMEYERDISQMTPTQNVIYEWAGDLPLSTFPKTRILRNILLNPELIKMTCSERGMVPPPALDGPQLAKRLNDLHSAWIQWAAEKDSRIPDEPFSSDWIAKYGETDLIIQCFFDESLADGLDSLVTRFPNIAPDWQNKQAISGKYLKVKEAVERQTSRIRQGLPADGKILFISPYHKRGITRWLGDPKIKDSEWEDSVWSLYEIMRTEWLKGLPDDIAVNMDGSRSFDFRDRQAAIWREDGARNIFVLATMDSIRESMDWAIRDTESTKNIKRMDIHWLAWPYGMDEFEQLNGRGLRPGQSKSVGIKVTESENSIDQGFYNLIRRKYLLTQMALAGVVLTKEDQEFFNKTSTAKRILEVQPSAGQIFLHDATRKLRGLGEKEIANELSQIKDGASLFELFAKFYFDEGKDEFRVVGNVAELVKNILLRSNPRKLLSVGAGTALFARKVTRSGFSGQIDNLDINGASLRIAKEHYPQIGNIIVGKASELTASASSYDAVDCSYMLNWTNLYNVDGQVGNDPTQIERVKTLLEINRVLKFNGVAAFTFPESCFDVESFSKFAQGLESHFGMTVLTSASGVAYATDTEPKKKIGWIITVQKTGRPELAGLNPKDLTILGDNRVKISKYKGKKDDKEPKVVKIEYPIFSSKNFEVRNPLTQERSTANAPTIGSDQKEDIREKLQEIKSVLTSEQWTWWRGVRRDLEKKLGRRYGESEEVLAGILLQNGLERPADWQVRYIQKLVDIEIRRMTGNGH
jgi:hypothetical protein